MNENETGKAQHRASKAKSEHEKRNNSWPRTDAGNAELFACLFKDSLRYDHRRKRWLVWNKHWWAEDETAKVYELAKKAARARLSFANASTNQEIKDQLSWATQSESRARIEAVLKLAQSEKPLADNGKCWDSNPFLFGVLNGVVDLKTGKLRDGHPSDRITIRSNVNYDASAKCPLWERFLSQIFQDDKDLITFVQRAIGYSLTGSTSEQCIFLCYGEGANGKTTFFEAIRHVLGGYAHNTPFSTLELNGRSSISNDVAALVDKRFVTASETNEAVRLNEARVKALTGSDVISARFLYGEWFDFHSSAKCWLAFNHKPLVSDDSHGFWRRIRLIPFLRKFTGNAIDKDLLTKLHAEAPGILARAIQGCLDWQQNGLGSPAAVQAATEEYQKESDSLEAFIEDYCEVGDGFSTTAKELWEHYQRWEKDSDQGFCLNRKAFSGRLQQRGFTRHQEGHARTRYYHGIALRPQADAQSEPSNADTRTQADAQSSNILDLVPIGRE